MKDYVAPLQDMRFVLQELVGLESLATLPGFEEASADTVDAVLEEAGRFANEVLSPLNWVGDREGARFAGGEVSTARGWREAYRQFSEGGWGALAIETRYGGQGLPRVVGAALNEIWNGANLAFALCPMLTAGAIEALVLRGSDALKARYIPPLVEGRWTGTMNLTEPQAGSDLSQIRTRAARAGDGSFRISGQKIYITYGEHDLAENIIHMVLARIDGAPEGVKGLSLFLVPKVLVNEDGTLGARNDVRCLSIEHKLGIHGSPTCVMAYGEAGGATGYLVGEENRGLEIMFIMMNAARYAVGIEGLALAERAYQAARDYARERVQGGAPATILHHPDVRRMLLSMKAQVEAMRALAMDVAAAMDRGERETEASIRDGMRAYAELMIPVVKGWCTEQATEIASTGIQVFGGMGYIEETGAAQFLRDARITSIYEGTTAIQANDLVGRKVLRDGGAALSSLLAAIEATIAALAREAGEHFAALAVSLALAHASLAKARDFMLAKGAENPREAYAGSVPFLKLVGVVGGGWQLARAALAASRLLAAGQGDAEFLRAKILTARFYGDHILSSAPGLSCGIVGGAAATLEMPDGQF